MRASVSKPDYLRLRPMQALGQICLPLILVNAVLAVTSTLTNKLYSQYAGQTYFTVTGYLSVVTTLFISIVSSVYTAAWIKIAHQFAVHDKQTVTNSMRSALLAVALASAGCSLLLILFTQPVLRAMSIPAQLYSDTRLYYALYLLSYLPTGLAAFFLTIVNGIGNTKRIFWINIVVLFTNLLAAWLLLSVLRLHFVGAALCAALGSVMQLGLYLLLFRRDGFFHSARQPRPDWPLVGSILRYSVPIALQNLLCTAGYLLVTLQTNRLLSSQYITVLNVSLPLTGIMSAVTSAGLAFLPPNYAAGNTARLRRFLVLSLGCCFAYGILCCVLYWTLGEWYFGLLFTDPEVIAYGLDFWRWYGLGHLALALVHPLRTFFISVGRGTIGLLSGLGEFIGNALCAFVLIPQLGNVGRSLSYPLGWAFAAVFLLAAYVLTRKKLVSCKRKT